MQENTKGNKFCATTTKAALIIAERFVKVAVTTTPTTTATTNNTSQPVRSDHLFDGDRARCCHFFGLVDK